MAQHWWDYTLPVVSMMLKNPEPWTVIILCPFIAMQRMCF